MGTVLALCTSEKKGIQKQNRHTATFIEDWGIDGDAHAGKWHRQVSLLSADKIEAFKQRKPLIGDTPIEIPHGAFGENIVVQGIDFRSLPLGTRFYCNEVILELTQIGKQCHDHCQIYERMGECIMPKEGVFTKVIHGGTISEGDTMTYTLPFTAAVITISDSGSQGTRADASGPAIVKELEKRGYPVVSTAIIPDDKETISKLLTDLADKGVTHDTQAQSVNLILTTGGTGFSPRDITPEATKAIIEKEVPGIPEVMRLESLKITPRAMLSRATAGIRGQTLIVNLPGSPKACIECMSFIMDTIVHGLEILTDKAHNCAR